MKKPNEIAESYISIGKAKTEQNFWKTFVLGMLAGAFIAFGGVGSTFGNVYLNKVAGAAIFPGGLAMVLIAGSELFTGNCLLIIPLMKKEISFLKMLRCLAIVYLGNFVGAAIIATLTSLGGVFSADAVRAAVVSTAEAKASMPFYVAFIKGVLCNVLVCIAVWMSFAADTVGGKIAGLFFPIMIFVVAGFEHSVANMYYLPAGLITSLFYGTETTLTVGGAIINNLIPVTLGNVVGGMLVGAAYCGIYLTKKKQD